MLRLVRTAAMAQAKRIPIPRNGVDYRGKVVLAPMVRSGELPCRLTALKYGADLVWGPETVDRALIGTNIRRNPRSSAIEFTRVPSNRTKTSEQDGDEQESVIYRIQTEAESSRLIFQVGTASPELAVQACELVAPYVAGIDVNAGCPKPFSTSGGMGAALLSVPDRLCSILRALVEHIGNPHEIGVSVKIRLLADENDTRNLVEQLVATGITGLTVHCRTRAMRKHERAIREQLRMVGEICHAAGVACLMNGDVTDRAEALALMEEYGVDGAMIATAAEKNPTVFLPVHSRAVPWRDYVRTYFEAALREENRWPNTKFSLAQIVPGKIQKEKNLVQARNYAHVCDMLGFSDLSEDARELDNRLGLTHNLSKSGRKDRNKARAPQEREEVPTKRSKHEFADAGSGQATTMPMETACFRVTNPSASVTVP